MRSSPQPSKQDLVNDLNKYRGELLRSNTKRYLAGTESLPFLSILFSNVDRNNPLNSSNILNYPKHNLKKWDYMGYHGIYGSQWYFIVFSWKKC